MKFGKKAIFGLALLTLFACGSNTEDTMDARGSLLSSWESPEKPIKGGTLMTAVVASGQSTGLFSTVFAGDALDLNFSQVLESSLFWIDDSFNIVDGGMANLSVDYDNNKLKVVLKPNLKWSDGEPLTVDDIIYTYHVVGSPDYNGYRFSDSMLKIVGMKDYFDGKAKTIKGLKKLSDTELEIDMMELSGSITSRVGAPVPSTILPKHYLGDIAIKDLDKSDKIRDKAISYGAYMLKNVVVGESAEYVPNPYYYSEENKPQVDSLIVKILPASSMLTSMRNGEYDFYTEGVQAEAYPTFKEYDNLAVLGRPDFYFNYLGFNLGKWDDATSSNIVDTNAKMYDLNLRKAIAYALNVELVSEAFYNGLRERATTPIPPVQKDYFISKKFYSYNPEKANEILDKAGYKDVDGDGLRENPKGEKLQINLAFAGGTDLAEPISQQYIQDLRAVGLDVVLATGRLMEPNGYFQKIRANDKDIDMFIGAFGTGENIDPSGLFGVHSRFNMNRWVSDENTRLMKEVSSDRALKDPEYKREAVKAWAENYMENELGLIPLQYRYDLSPINKRVKKAGTDFASEKNQYPDQVVSNKPFAL